MYTKFKVHIRIYKLSNGISLNMVNPFPSSQRYYGKSLPYGSSTFTPDHMGYLSAEQALADYAVLIAKLRTEFSISKVICFGGR